MQFLRLHKLRNTLLVLLVGVVTSCTEIIELELNTDTESLVVDAILSNQDRYFVVKLSRTVPYFATDAAPPVNHAYVEIINERTKQSMVLVEDSLLTGHYFAEASLEMLVPGDTLKLMIKQIDLKGDGNHASYWSTAIVPELVELDSAQIRYNVTRETWQMLAYFQDPPEVENFYQFKVVHNNYTVTRRPDDIRINSDQLFNGNYVNGVWVHSVDASNEASQFEDGDRVALQLIAISENFYNFIYAIHQEINTSVPLFTGPAANVPGNISGNALGFFAVTAVSEYEIIFDSAIHNQ
ncbi:MAG: DUF4249 domain-containing protein [Bacteroidales bacterium]|nr:DUF4249 domain-containing protein [Bacteroidales bacterium]